MCVLKQPIEAFNQEPGPGGNPVLRRHVTAPGTKSTHSPHATDETHTRYRSVEQTVPQFQNFSVKQGWYFRKIHRFLPVLVPFGGGWGFRPQRYAVLGVFG